MKTRKCNYPNCNKEAKHIEPFGSMGGSDAYCERHQKKRDKLSKKEQR